MCKLDCASCFPQGVFKPGVRARQRHWQPGDKGRRQGHPMDELDDDPARKRPRWRRIPSAQPADRSRSRSRAPSYHSPPPPPPSPPTPSSLRSAYRPQPLLPCASTSTSLSSTATAEATFELSLPARSLSGKSRTSEEKFGERSSDRTTTSREGGQARVEEEAWEEKAEEEDERENSGRFSSILGKWQQQLVPASCSYSSSSSPKQARLRLQKRTREISIGRDQGIFVLNPDLVAVEPLAFSPALSGSLLFSQASSMSPKAPKWLRRMSSVVGVGPGLPPPPPPGAVDAFVAFVEADSFPGAREQFDKLLSILELEPGRHPDFYPKLKLIKEHLPFRYREIFKFLTDKRKAKPYSGYPCEKQKVLVVGSGPCGLRTAIEAQLLGSEVVVVERRDDFTRHNILKLWKFLVQDFKLLGVKKFIGNFCSGQINHVGIRTLQLFLAKVALILGVRIVCPARMVGLVEPEADGHGWKAKLDPPGSWADNFYFNVLVAASGKNVCVDGFNRRSLDAKLSIAVTANFVNGGTREEAQVSQISGISRQYHQDFFKSMNEEVGIDLENIVYYRGETHYFVMTALRKSLIEKGVILSDSDDRKALLAPSNINRAKLHAFAIEAAQYSTGHFSRQLPVTEFAMDARGRPDCAVFDFTNLYSARNACQVKVRRGFQLLLACVGDSLLEPFWPEGTGCGRGVLSSLDTAWLIRQWSLERINPLEIITERENIYKLLSQTSDGHSSELKSGYQMYTINPATRYQAIPRKIDHERILELYDTDAQEEFDFLKDKFVHKQFYEAKAHLTLLQKLRRGLAKQGGGQNRQPRRSGQQNRSVKA